jgi:ferritin
MNIEEFVRSLCRDLSNEYSHWHFYMQAATNVKGLHRQELSEFFLEQASGEMKHVEQFRRVIQGLITKRGLNLNVPSVVAPFEENLFCPKDLLRAALKMEEKVVGNYVTRIDQASLLQENGGQDKDDGKYVELFLEDQIADSRGDADNIREMLENAIDA